MLSDPEEWRAVLEAPGYYVSNLGRVKGPRGIRKLQPSQGYPQIVVCLPNGQNVVIRAHVQVCTLWHGPKPFAKAQALHKDGVKANCRSDNLYWGTHQQNMDDMVQQGASCSGENHPDAKLTWDIVRSIRLRIASGEPQIRLAREYKVSPPLISMIHRNVIWKESFLEKPALRQEFFDAIRR